MMNSFPFVVVNELNNGTHNGLATFLFDDTRVSALSFQFVQETMAWERNDYWGRAPLAYAAGPIADESARRARLDEAPAAGADAALVGLAGVGPTTARRHRR